MKPLSEISAPMVEQFGKTWWGKILAYAHTEPTELIMGGFAKWVVGTWLSLPFKSFQASPTFYEIGRIFPEEAWAVTLMGLGALHMFVLRQGKPKYRMVMSTIGFLIWFSMAFSFLVTNTPAFGAMLFFMAAICQGWCAIRLSREVM